MIDTLAIRIAKKKLNNYSIEDLTNKLNKLPEVIDMYTKSCGKDISIVLKPSRSSNRCTSTIFETSNLIKSIEKDFNVSSKLLRFDIAYDTNDKLEEKRNIFTLFLGCINYIRSNSCYGISSLNSDFVIKNIKISNNKLETTIYDSQDKINRKTSTRIENRIKRASSSGSLEQIIKKDTIKYLDELNNVTKILPFFEKSYVDFLIEIWNKNKEKYSDNTEFINTLDLNGLIMTRAILSQLLSKIGYTGKLESFIKNFRRNRCHGLNFVSQNDLKKLISELKKNSKLIFK